MKKEPNPSTFPQFASIFRKLAESQLHPYRRKREFHSPAFPVVSTDSSSSMQIRGRPWPRKRDKIIRLHSGGA